MPFRQERGECRGRTAGHSLLHHAPSEHPRVQVASMPWSVVPGTARRAWSERALSSGDKSSQAWRSGRASRSASREAGYTNRP